MLSKLSNISKSAYLFFVSICSRMSHKKHGKVIFLLSFPSTSEAIITALYSKIGNDLIICYTSEAAELASQYAEKGCKIYPIDSFKVLMSQIVPLVTCAKVVLCDNYFAFLGGINDVRNRKIVQIWHANGAIKHFGLKANYTKNRSRIDVERYKKVYKKFTHYVISSDKMKEIFENNYQTKIQTLPFGYPQTDYFYDKNWIEDKKNLFEEKFPTTKKILLYVPTYRESENNKHSRFLEIITELQDEWLVLMKPHPHEKEKYTLLDNEKKVIFDFKGMLLNEILPSVDCLVTDYSSIPFEYALANPKGKMVFYCYDYLEYDKMVGIENDFKEWVPGKLVYNEERLLAAIKAEEYQSLDQFNLTWNQYVNGTSRSQILEWVRIHNES